MANTVIALKKSATPSSAPADLANGELAINYADGKLFYKNTSGQIAEISGAVSSASFGTVNAAGTLLIADTTNDVLTIDQGDNIIITGDAINDKFTITANLTPANNWANTLAVSINAYALETATSIGTAGNNYTNAVGSSSNIFSQSVGDAGNNYTNAVGTAGNNYTILVGSSANNWANTKLSNTTNVWFSGNLNISEDLYIGRNITNVTQLVFNTGTNIVPTTPGALTWSQDDLTLRFDMDSPSNVIQHIGQDLFYLVKNQTGSTISKGTVVRFAGTLGASGRLLIAPAIANNSYPSKYIMGVAAASINDGDDGFVLAQGKLKQIDTSMFSAGDILYVSSTTPGAFSNTIPTAPNNKVTVAAVVKSDNNGTLEVRLTLGSKLNEDELVELSSLANGDVIIYNSAHGHFENKPQSDINAGLLDGYNTSSSNVSNTVVVRDQWGNFSAGNITCSLSNTGTIDMRLSASDPGQVEGRIWYDGTLDHALNYYTDITGVSVAMGCQQVFRVRNATANTFTVGQAVYASGGSVSKVPDIDLAISNDLLKSQVIGVVFGANIGPNSFGYVLAMGTYVHGDTNAYGAEGTRLYLSPTTPGALQNTIPPAPYHPVQIGVVTYQNNTQGTILISSIQRLSGLNLANGSIGFLVDGTQARIGEDNANLRFDTSNTTLHVAKANVGSLFVGSINVEPAFAAVNNHISGVGSSGNAYALSTATTIGTAGNNYTNAVGTAGNNYSLSIVTASNNYAIGTYVKLTAPSQTITGDFSITGNLFIGGNTTSVSANNLIVNDPLIYLANNNVSDTLDIGFVGSYYNVSSAHVHTGLYRDHVSKQYYLFQGYDANPDNNNEITPYSNNMVNATLVADLITSNLTLGGANAIVLIKSAYDSSNSGLAAGNAYALSTATSVGTAGNNYTNAVGAAGNAYTLSITTSVGDAGNNYTNTVGVSGNNYATAVGSGANNYLLGVTTAGNNYVITIFNQANAAFVKANAVLEVSNTAPVNPSQGTLWWHSEYGRLFINYIDDDTSQWVDATPSINVDVITNLAQESFNKANIAYTMVDSATNLSIQASNLANSSYELANGAYLKANLAYSYIDPSFTKANSAYITSASSFTKANLAHALAVLSYNASNAAASLSFVNTAAGSANTYANSLVLSSNAYIIAVGSSGNAYALSTATSIGTAGNNYTNLVGSSGNNYTNLVGSSGNNYTNDVSVAGNNYTNVAYSMANAAYIQANLAATTGKAIAMAIVFGG